MDTKHFLKNPMIQVVLVVAVVVSSLLAVIFFSKKVMIDGNECYIMPLLGTVRCGLAHKYIFGIIAFMLVLMTVGIFAWMQYMKKKN
jgi:hypothetical protein